MPHFEMMDYIEGLKELQALHTNRYDLKMSFFLFISHISMIDHKKQSGIYASQLQEDLSFPKPR